MEKLDWSEILWPVLYTMVKTQCNNLLRQWTVDLSELDDQQLLRVQEKHGKFIK